MIELEVKNVKKYYGANLIFEDINFDVKTKERVAIVGRNGCGKSSIFNIIVDKEKQDKGEILKRKNLKLGYLEQIPKFENYKVKEILNLGFSHLIKLEENLRDLEKDMKNENCNMEKILNKYSNLQQEYETLGGYEKETKISKVRTGLNINEDFLEAEFDSLSGGEKTRVMLGKILIESPDLLLLDEPTNHLDMKSVEWLESYLKDYDGSVIIVSHDRYFLDKVVNKVVEIENLTSKTYIGNYSSYLSQKEEALILANQNYKEQQKKIKAMEESIKQLKVFSRNGSNEKFVKRAQSMKKRLDKIDKLENPNKKIENMKININNNSKQSQDVILIKEGSKAFDNKLLFKDVDILVRKGENIALIGDNGCGKSTLVKIILQEEKLDSGNLKVASSSKIGYLPQNVEFEDEEKTILDWFREDIVIAEGKAREYLSKYMFFKEDVFKKVKSLSGGEKSRLKLSKILYFEVNLLILDEPTNHLDIESINNLEKVLKDFKGSILFVSHDRYFINNLCNKILSIEDNQILSWNGNYDYYKEKREELKNKVKPVEVIKVSKKTEKPKVEEERKINKDKIEKDIEKLEGNIKELDFKIQNIDCDYIKLQSFLEEKNKLEGELDNLLNKWTEVESY
ncbi:ribosomal protection-like ABC-F family protein [Paraclostridium sordellii]|uniref:ABC transporter-like protein n=1 Tax=Paraclostridium sordellii TaxID=1505 RepID=A0A0C7R3H5_PARSO|nr:ABC-F type ribosomal protection protein [Paeniclostridium sordellii]CEN77602.1 ABC transporter-like protein [[Clostridium] sordellii] [Paeniclostridium sordellii]CEQ02689.1 ABC transporter-like protein [[Clostridium] sordellii] [Paeniclostridium sordellii]